MWGSTASPYLAPMVEFDAAVYLIFERTTPNTFTTFPCVSRVSCLSHEVFDNTMEDVIVVISINTMLYEVPTR